MGHQQLAELTGRGQRAPRLALVCLGHSPRLRANYGGLGVSVGDIVEKPVCIGEANTVPEDRISLDELYLKLPSSAQIAYDFVQCAECLKGQLPAL